MIELPVRPGRTRIRAWSLRSGWASWAETCRPAAPPASSGPQSSGRLGMEREKTLVVNQNASVCPPLSVSTAALQEDISEIESKGYMLYDHTTQAMHSWYNWFFFYIFYLFIYRQYEHPPPSIALSEHESGWKNDLTLLSQNHL